MNDVSPPLSAFAPTVAGGARGVLEAAGAALAAARPAALALTLSCTGSTYVRPGAMALFHADGGQTGWLSGGCLEPEIAACARRALDARRIEWLELDTRHDEDLFDGAAVGCRGRLRVALLPLPELPLLAAPLAAWIEGEQSLSLRLDSSGAFVATSGRADAVSVLAAAAMPWADDECAWCLDVPCPPRVLVCGAGPETPLLLPLLRAIGMRSVLVERRPRWRGHGELADRHLDSVPEQALAAAQYDAALVMHHNFELDRQALAALAASTTPFIGLLGPVRRREDLFRVLSASMREALSSRLHAPVGLDLGGRGAEAIALSIAAQLQAHLLGGSLR